MGMRPSIGSSGMGISSGNSGSSRSTSISVNQGGVTVGVNLGIAEVGISTDYGGAGKIGFGGQSVTWGLEGGKIQMGIAGFELIVEARNCVVTEIKKIAGQVVSTRTYPDPGCNEEEEKESKPPPFDPEKGLELIDGTELVYVFVDSKVATFVRQSSSISGLSEADDHHLSYKFTISQIPEIVPAYSGSGSIPFKVTSKFEGSRNIIKNRDGSPYYTQATVVTNDNEWNLPQGDRLVAAPTQFPGVFYTTKLSLSTNIQRTCTINDAARPINECSSLNEGPNPFIIYGSKTNCKAFLEYIKKKDTNTTSGTVYYYSKDTRFSHPISYIIPVGTVPKPKPLEGGNRPPMNSSCCKAILADLEDLKEVLAVKEMLKGECTFPWRLRMPDGQGEEIIYDYPNFLRALAQEIDHLGIHPPKLFIQDNNNAQEGDQTVDIKFPSATSAFEALMKQVWDDNADGDTRTNFLYRLAWLAIQNQEATIKLSAKIHAIADALGVELEADTAKFPVPFNIAAGVAAGVNEKATRGQGFGKNSKPQIDSKIDINSELATESLLPQFLKCRENEVLIERFAGSRDMIDILSLILMHVEKLNSK